MSDASVVITGLAYGRRATLRITGDTLMWRAQRTASSRSSRAAENIATTIHHVRDARWIDLAWSRGGAALVVAGVLLFATQGLQAGLITLAAGAALLIWRRRRPRQFLVLEIGDRRLILRVAAASASAARDLAAHIQQTLASGELPTAAPTLP